MSYCVSTVKSAPKPKNLQSRFSAQREMFDHHNILKFPSLCSEGIDYVRTSQNETDEVCFHGHGSEGGVRHSLEFAKHVKVRSRENCHNPTESLHMLSSGKEALNSRTSAVSAVILQALYIYSTLCALVSNTSKYWCPLQEDIKWYCGKKKPEEHYESCDDSIIATGAPSQSEDDDDDDDKCCKCKGDTKTSSKKSVSASQGTQDSARASEGIQSGSTSPFNGAYSSFGGHKGGNDGDDDDDENKQRRKINGSNCNGNFPIDDDDDDDDKPDSKDDIPSAIDDATLDDDMTSTTAEDVTANDVSQENDDIKKLVSAAEKAAALVYCIQQDESSRRLLDKGNHDVASSLENAALNDGQGNTRPRLSDKEEEKREDKLISTVDNKTFDNDDDIDYVGGDEDDENGDEEDKLVSTVDNDRSDDDNDSDDEEEVEEEDKAAATDNEKSDDDDDSEDGSNEEEQEEPASAAKKNNRDDDSQQIERPERKPVKSNIDMASATLIRTCLDDSIQESERCGNNPIYDESSNIQSADGAMQQGHNHLPITQTEIDDLIQDILIRSKSYTSVGSHEVQPIPSPFAINAPERSDARIVSRGAPGPSGQGEGDFHQENVSERPQNVRVLHPFNEEILSVQNGRYDEGFEWRKVQEDRSYLGQGSSGKCYLSTDLRTNNLFAVKKIPITKYDPIEREVWSQVSGENMRCLELYGAVKVHSSVLFFMEYMEGGSVAQLLYNYEGGLGESSSLYILREVLESLFFHHSMNIIHCDVKCENIFVNDTLTKVKLGDYGAARQLLTQDQDCKNTIGTEHFMSPEACRGEQLSYSTDIWGAACSMVQMLTGNLPWFDYPGSVLYKVGSLKETPPLPECSPAIKELLTKMFALKAADRPSAKELLCDPVFAEVVWQPFGNNEVRPEGSVPDQNADPIGAYHLPTTPLSTREVDDHIASEEGDQMCNERMPGVDEELQQLQSELFFSLSLECEATNAGALMMNGVDRDTVSEEEGTVEVNQDLVQFLEVQEDNQSYHSFYSIKDLTKVEFYNSEGELLVGIREKSCCTFKRLARSLHHVFEDKDERLECFTFETMQNTAIDIEQVIGASLVKILVQPATEANWGEKWPWRVNREGIIECQNRATTNK